MSKRGFLSGKKRLLESVNSWGCDSCGLFKGVKSPKMEPYGEYQLEVMCIGDAPGKTEDVKDLPWQGKSGQFLQGIFEELDYDLFRDCTSLNAVNCLPFEKDKIRTPSDHEIVCCRDVKVRPAIEKYKPNVIIFCLVQMPFSLWLGKSGRKVWEGYPVGVDFRSLIGI